MRLLGGLFGSFHLLLAIVVLIAMAVFCFAVSYLYFGDALDYRCVPDPYYDPGRGHFMLFSLILILVLEHSMYPDADLSGGQYWTRRPTSGPTKRC